MTKDTWERIVQAAIAKSGLPYRVLACGCSPTCVATVEHARTKALREISVSRDLFPPDAMPNEIIHQLRAFNIDFAARCAKGHLPILQFEREELAQLLADGTLAFYCVMCDESRKPTVQELDNIRQLLAEAPV